MRFGQLDKRKKVRRRSYKNEHAFVEVSKFGMKIYGLRRFCWEKDLEATDWEYYKGAEK